MDGGGTYSMFSTSGMAVFRRVRLLLLCRLAGVEILWSSSPDCSRVFRADDAGFASSATPLAAGCVPPFSSGAVIEWGWLQRKKAADKAVRC